MSEQNGVLRLIRSIAAVTLLTATVLASLVFNSGIGSATKTTTTVVPSRTSSKYPIVLPSANDKATIKDVPAQIPVVNSHSLLRQA